MVSWLTVISLSPRWSRANTSAISFGLQPWSIHTAILAHNRESMSLNPLGHFAFSAARLCAIRA